MPVIYQPVRVLLEEQVKKYSHYIKGKVLDVGAGSFSRYEGLFNCSEYIKMDVEKGNNVDIVGRAENIPFKNESFDSVVCTEVFEHLEDPYKAAGEIYRVLKRGGYCLITTPQTCELHEEPKDFFRYTNFGLKKIFTVQGFKVIKCEQRGGFFTTIAQQKMRYLVDRLNLYQKKWSRLLNPVFKLYSKLMNYLDKIDDSKANQKHTLGWCLILQK
ncbi:MAG: class I SAM-dependent methyltransferase [Patescibacteria group bacterium]